MFIIANIGIDEAASEWFLRLLLFLPLPRWGDPPYHDFPLRPLLLAPIPTSGAHVTSNLVCYHTISQLTALFPPPPPTQAMPLCQRMDTFTIVPVFPPSYYPVLLIPARTSDGPLFLLGRLLKTSLLFLPFPQFDFVIPTSSSSRTSREETKILFADLIFQFFPSLFCKLVAPSSSSALSAAQAATAHSSPFFPLLEGLPLELFSNL